MREWRGIWDDGRHWHISLGEQTNTALPVIAVAAIVLVAEGIVVVHSEKRAGWEFPIGKVEKYEVPLEALHREISEEAGVSIEHAAPVGSISLSAPFQERVIQSQILLFLVCGRLIPNASFASEISARQVVKYEQLNRLDSLGMKLFPTAIFEAVHAVYHLEVKPDLWGVRR